LHPLLRVALLYTEVITTQNNAGAVDLFLLNEDLRVIAYHPAEDPTSGDVNDPKSWYCAGLPKF